MTWISTRKYQTYQTWCDNGLQLVAPCQLLVKPQHPPRFDWSNPPGKFQSLHGFFLQQSGAMLGKATVVKHSHKEVGIRHGTHQTTLQMSHDTTSRPKLVDLACANHRKHQKSSFYIVRTLFCFCYATLPCHLNLHPHGLFSRKEYNKTLWSKEMQLNFAILSTAPCTVFWTITIQPDQSISGYLGCLPRNGTIKSSPCAGIAIACSKTM